MRSAPVAPTQVRGGARFIHRVWDLTNGGGYGTNGSATGGNLLDRGGARGDSSQNFFASDAAPNVNRLDIYKRRFSATWYGAYARWWAANLTGPLTKPAVNYIAPEYNQVQVWGAEVCIRGGSLSSANDCGFFFAGIPGASPGLMWNGANRGFGVFRSETGQLQWRAKTTNVVGYAEVTSLAAFDNLPDEWHKFEYVFRPALFNREAAINLYIDDVLAITRQWGAGSVLPDIPADAAGVGSLIYTFAPCFASTELTAGKEVHCAGAWYYSGPDDTNTL